MKKVVFGGFLLVSGAILTSSSTQLDNILRFAGFAAMIIGLLVSSYYSFSNED